MRKDDMDDALKQLMDARAELWRAEREVENLERHLAIEEFQVRQRQRQLDETRNLCDDLRLVRKEKHEAAKLKYPNANV